MAEYIKEICKIARQLGYPKETITALRKAQSESECTRIMCTARERSFED